MRRIPSWLLPLLLAAVQLAAWLGARRWTQEPVDPAELATGLAAVTLAAAALCWRRRAPLAALAGVAGATSLGQFAIPDVALTVLSLSEFVALYSVAVRRPLGPVLGATGALLGWHALAGAVAGDVSDLLLVEYLFVATTGHGHRRWLAGRRAAADRLARAVAEQQRAASDERHRLARELHDVSAHHLTSIVVSADAARRLADQRPELVSQALEYATRTGREALGSLHRLVAVVQRAELADTQPLRARLDELAAGFLQVGMVVGVEVSGDGFGPDGDVVLGIAREALTNALRYAPGSRVQVTVLSRDGRVELLVDDDGPAATAPGTALASSRSLGSGRGLAGARERAAAAGGTLSARPRPGGGWRVHAVLPGTGPGQPPSRRLPVKRLVDATILGVLVGLPAAVVLASSAHDAAAVTMVMASHAAPLWWRRRAPWAALISVLATAWLAPIALDNGLVTPETAPVLLIGGAAEFVAVHAVAVYGRRGWTAWPAAPAAAGGLGAVLLTTTASAGPVVAILALALAGVWGEAYINRLRRDRVLTAEENALAVAADQAVAAAHAERLRIAAELRSAVLHEAALVVTVAEEGRLDAVADQARATLAAMRELLGTLRGDDPPAPYAPQPTAAAIDRLCDEHRAAGRTVAVDQPEPPPSVPADVGLSVFRIVEAALGAGDTDPASVVLEYLPDELIITVAGVPSAVAGPAAAGLRARVAVLGGRIDTLAAGTLRAWLPMRTGPEPVTPP